ncbi:type I-E CRISPR-associated protein Cse2/CasB [Streptomyces sp. NPDC057697]|uniref:type I-E CRISPR-associated protein Cse2/CasB n=1 Tax=Streptomyces sp. NPDC057697 TaxID=3346219 RepID=UPI0036A3E9AA
MSSTSQTAGHVGGKDGPTVRELVEQATHTYVAQLQFRYFKDDPAAVAEMAQLRRGAGKRAHEIPELWGFDALEKLAELMPKAASGSARREDAEEAVFLASTLWALHQQSRPGQKTHVRGKDLGGAVRALIRLKKAESADEEESPLRKRLVRVGTAESFPSVAVRLREIVTLLRSVSEPPPLDYARLAGQLYQWQDRSARAGVQREWGREFHLAASAPRAGKGKQPDAENADAIDTTLSADEGGASAEDSTYGGYAAGE